MDLLDAAQLATEEGLGFGELTTLQFEAAEDAHRAERVGVGFAEEGDFEREYGAVKIGGFVEARLAVAEAGQLGAEVDDGGVGAAGRGLE